MTSDPRRVLVVGWDGASWNALDPWIAEGRLPHLARLRREGVWGDLRSTAPPVTPAAWTTMATGLMPGRTGALGFRHLDLRRPSGYCPTMASSADLAGRTLFEHALARGESVAAVGWPMTWPPFPLPGGVLLSGWPRPTERRAPTWPAHEGRRLGPWAAGAPRSRAGTPSVEHDIARTSWWDRRHAEIACTWLRERDDGIVAVVFSGYDHLAHRLWGDPRLAEHAERLDGHLGALLEAAGPDVGVLFVSDHGFEAAPRRRVHLDRWLERTGWSTRIEGPGTAGGWLGRARAAVPYALWSSLSGRLPAPIRRAAYERARATAGLDLPACRAVRVPLHEGWDGVHLLVEGRTEGGALAPADAPAALDRLEAALLSARLPSGRALVAGVERGDAAPGLEHRVPDLIVDFGAEARGGGGMGEGPLEDDVDASELARFPGAHRRAGALLLHGPGLTGRAPQAAHVADVLPTALAWRGVPVPDDLDGSVLQTLLRRSARYETAPRRAPRPPPTHRGVEPTELERLGYLRS